MRDTLERRSPSDIDQVFGVHRSLAGEGPEDRCREPRVFFQKAEKSSKWNRREGQQFGAPRGVLPSPGRDP
jgi:hypothetical protein